MSKNIIRLKGENVSLCPIRSDEEAVLKYTEWMNDEEILQWLGRNNKVTTYDEEVKWATRDIDRDDKVFNIVENRTGNLIGNCDISIRRGTQNGIVGICIGDKDSRDCGYGTEVMKMLIKFGFEELNLHALRLQANSENARALRCYEKAGFKVCGTEHETQWFNNRWCDTVHMEILRQDYEK
jgi:RimJ/RimL family protein N-acetyltransferase